MDSTRKNARTLDMYVRLCEGKVINKKRRRLNLELMKGLSRGILMIYVRFLTTEELSIPEIPGQ